MTFEQMADYIREHKVAYVLMAALQTLQIFANLISCSKHSNA